MSTAKTKIDKEIIVEFVKNSFSKDAESFETIADGEMSQGFFFSANKKDFVIRVNKRLNGFEKDKYAYEHFYSKDMPIPKTILLGELNKNLYFSITERAKGRLLCDYNEKETHNSMPNIIKTLDAIHAVDISKTKGFGSFDSQGKTDFQSHTDALTKQIKMTLESFKKEADNKLLEKDVIEYLLKKYKALFKYCPEIRYLVHGDFGSDNVTVNNNQITGVFDWELASYGDFLFDVAWLDFWRDNIDYKGIFLRHYQKKGVDTKNYEERILCYKLNFGIGSLMFYINSGQEKKYLATKAELMKMV
jgi:hygromycin-B 4-O-kinase|tara:strand:+ start:112 stop:1023 length:912 start_codon:yes stop_codon:yes gene_type:complete